MSDLQMCRLSMPHVFFSGYFQKHKEFTKTVRVEEIDGLKLVKNLAVKMEEVFRKKAEATRVGRAFDSMNAILNYLLLKIIINKSVSVNKSLVSLRKF